jgi:hypothetical protein
MNPLIPAQAGLGQEIKERSLYLILITPDDRSFKTLNKNNQTNTGGAKISEECKL